MGCRIFISAGDDSFLLVVNWFFKKLVDVNYPSRKQKQLVN